MNINIHPLKTDSWAACHRLLTRLYGPAAPTIYNLPQVDQLVTVEARGEVLGFCTGFLHPAFPAYYLVGNYQCVAEQTVASRLLNKIKTVAQRWGKRKLLGPLNGSTWYPYRFSEKPVAPFFLEHRHQPYYLDQWLQWGFRPSVHYRSQREVFDTRTDFPDMAGIIQERGWTLLPFDLSRAQQMLAELHGFCQRTFADSPFFSPIGQQAFIDLYQPVLPLLDPRLIDLVHDGEQLVGLFFALPDAHQPGQVIVKTLARDPHPHYKGLAHLLSARFCYKAIKLGFRSMIHAYMQVDNRSNRVSRNFGGSAHQTHVLLENEL